MIRRLIILLLIVGCVYGIVDSTKTKENNYKYILETGGKTAFYIIDYKIINDEINITKDGSNWEVYPLAQIKQITDLNGIISWEMKEDKFYTPIDKIDTNIMSHSEKLIFNNKLNIYKKQKKNPLLGVAYSTFLPFAGHLYVDKWKKGLVFEITEFGLFTFGILPYGFQVLMFGQQTFFDSPNPNNPPNKTNHLEMTSFTKACFVGASIIHLLKVFDVYVEVKKYNNKLFKSIYYNEEPQTLGFKLQPTYQGANLTMSYAFN